MKNYYEILEVSPKASKEVIEKAYKVLAKRYHPDLYSDDKKEYAEEKLKEINVAYKILSDNLLRDQYDSELEKSKEIASNAEKNNKKNINEDYKVKGDKKKANTKKDEDIKYNGVFDLLPTTFNTIVNSFKKLKNITRTDLLALGLTILIMVTLGVILWVLPFTHNWMYNTFIGIFK